MDTTSFDTRRKYVRVVETRDNGMVEFEFAIGEPELFVELLLPGPAFREFCTANQVTLLDKAALAAEDDASQWEWNLRQTTHQRFK